MTEVPEKDAFGDEEAESKVAPSAPETDNSAKKKKREINPRFKDVKETGQWGEISRTERRVVGGICAIVVIIAVVVIAVVVSSADEEETTIEKFPPTSSPSAAPTDITIAAQLDIVLDAIGSSDFTSELLVDLPNEEAFYEGLMDDPSATPQQRAMSWLLYEDERALTAEVALRWALGSLFYQLNGEVWTVSEGWLSNDHICEWAKIECDINLNIRELVLSDNNLAGTIPNELAMMEDLRSIWLNDNQMTGTIPGAMLGSLPRLSFLYLNGNSLTGTIPTSLDITGEGPINFLYVQENSLTGSWPRIFCSGRDALREFGLDCDKIQCAPNCCNPYNCYYTDAPP